MSRYRKDNLVLAVDIGSSKTHLATVDAEKLKCLKKDQIDNDQIHSMFTSVLKSHTDLFPSIIHKVNISSCIRKLSTDITDICSHKGFQDIRTVKVGNFLPVTFHYQNPESLGSDRVADCLACNRLFKGENCIIIDSGTAITIDFLREGKVFEGGAILAGIGLQLKALHKNTDVLPLPQLAENIVPALPGKSTVQGITSGVLYATAGAVERCVREYKKKYGPDILTIATGGGWPFTEKLVDFEYVHLPELTLIGTACF
ncbi:MAG: type III pantothenate kinase [Fibrobacterota bacterium]